MEELYIELIKGTVSTIFDDFITGEPIIKEKAVAFLLVTDKGEEIIVVYDKNAVKMGLIKVGELLKCFGSRDGNIIVRDSIENYRDGDRFICNAIIGTVDEEKFKEQLNKMGAISLEELENRRSLKRE